VGRKEIPRGLPLRVREIGDFRHGTLADRIPPSIGIGTYHFQCRSAFAGRITPTAPGQADVLKRRRVPPAVSFARAPPTAFVSTRRDGRQRKGPRSCRAGSGAGRKRPTHLLLGNYTVSLVIKGASGSQTVAITNGWYSGHLHPAVRLRPASGLIMNTRLRTASFRPFAGPSTHKPSPFVRRNRLQFNS
jgi:hypothetical protein